MIREVGLESEYELQAEQTLEKEEIKYPRKKLRVYVDFENQKYYIEMGAAYALNLTTYNNWLANENGYYEITQRQLNEFELIYEIVYEYFDIVVKKQEDLIERNLGDMENDSDKIKSSINELKELRNELYQKNMNNDSKECTDSNIVESFFSKK